MLPGGWLFPGVDPIDPLSTRQLNRAIHAAAEAAGIDKRVSMHTLRHSFATHLLEQKVDIRVIQVLPGHKKRETTALYAQVATGMLREVVSLKVSDVDSQRMTLRIEQGKGSKDRYAMLSPVLLERLRAWWKFAHAQGKMRQGGWLFPGLDFIDPLSTRQLNRAVHAAAEAAGINKRVSMHTLRHSFATHLLEQKVDIRILQGLLGHKKLETTALYAQVATDILREVVSPIETLQPL